MGSTFNVSRILITTLSCIACNVPGYWRGCGNRYTFNTSNRRENIQNCQRVVMPQSCQYPRYAMWLPSQVLSNYGISPVETLRLVWSEATVWTCHYLFAPVTNPIGLLGFSSSFLCSNNSLRSSKISLVFTSLFSNFTFVSCMNFSIFWLSSA